MVMGMIMVVVMLMATTTMMMMMMSTIIHRSCLLMIVSKNFRSRSFLRESGASPLGTEGSTTDIVERKRRLFSFAF